MLVSVRIKNLAIIEEAEVVFGRGFTVVTGETGAGKSIMVGAIGLLLGERASADMVRTGATEAEVEGRFDLAGEHQPAPGEYGNGDELILRRVVGSDGRSRAYVNGSGATVSAIASLASGRLDISSQHQHQTLAREEAHLSILDAYAGTATLLAAYRETRAAAQRNVSELAALRKNAAERASREDYVEFQLKELAQIDPKPGEDEALAAELQVLKNAGRLSDAARAAEELLYSGDGAAVERARRAAHKLRDAAGFDARLAETAAVVDQAVINVEEAAAALRTYAGKTDFSPERLEEAEDRLAVLKRLIKKHAGQAGSLAEVVRKKAELDAELKALRGSVERLPEVEREARETVAGCMKAGEALSNARKKAGAAFAKDVTRELQRVAMQNARLLAAVEPAPPETEAVLDRGLDLPEDGFDRVLFILAANPGEEPRPLHRVASGGELSRLMLAVKRVTAARDPVSLYIFDEVDAGIGGAVAEVVGAHLRAIASGHQVVCITHLPQIAAMAEHHLLVTKGEKKGRTFVRVEALDEEGRVREIARMLGGVKITETTLAHAREMLAKAGSAA
ncbi:MAG: DNA repair protein RecN [Deltaproteobacteria bacterium]|nr:DNA repair protein RecN [Deltaproteobacteria bacterium]